MRLAWRECYYLYCEVTPTSHHVQQIFCRGATLWVDVLTSLQAWVVYDANLECRVHARFLHDRVGPAASGINAESPGTNGRTGRSARLVRVVAEAHRLNHWQCGLLLFLHYAVMVAYLAQGGANVNTVFQAASWKAADATGPVAFTGAMAAILTAANKATLEHANTVLEAATLVTFVAILAVGAGTADLSVLFDPANQHPEHVVDAFPIIFLSFVYQNVVPVVVKDLEGDRGKITQAIVAGTTAPLLLFLAWNAVILGNVAPGTDLSVIDPVALLQSGGGRGSLWLTPLVAAFSSLAIITSLIGFTYGLVDAWRHVLKIDSNSEAAKQQWKVPLLALVFVPPLAIAVANPDSFVAALEYGGAFGVSTLFLVLPPLMVWKERYGDDRPSLMTKPMVPLGKLPLGSMWKAAGTLILEQGADKLGVFDAIHSYFS